MNKFIVVAVCIVGLLSIWFFMSGQRQDTSTVFEVSQNLNPSGSNPLSVALAFEFKTPVFLEARLLSKDTEGVDLYFSHETATITPVLKIWGLYESHKNIIEISVSDADGVAEVLTTIEVNTPEVSKEYRMTQNSVVPDSVRGHFYSVENHIFDAFGNLRAKLETGEMTRMHPLSNLEFAFSPNRTVSSLELKRYVNTYDIMGTHLKEYKVPSGVHHEFIEMVPGGNFLAASNHHFQSRALDAVVEIDRETGEVVKGWDLRDVLDENRPRWQDRGPANWAHINSIQYDSDDNSLLISSKLQNSIIKLGYDDGLRWIIAPPHDWTPELDAFRLKPVNFDTDKHPDQDWTYMQHTASFLPNGDLIAYDNGAGRPGFTDTPDDHDDDIAGGYVRVVRYGIDDEAQTVTKINEWTDTPDIASNARGNIYPFGEDLFLVGHGEFSRVVILDQDWNTVVYEFEMEHTGERAGFYRVYPIDLGAHVRQQ